VAATYFIPKNRRKKMLKFLNFSVMKDTEKSFITFRRSKLSREESRPKRKRDRLTAHAKRPSISPRCGMEQQKATVLDFAHGVKKIWLLFRRGMERAALLACASRFDRKDWKAISSMTPMIGEDRGEACFDTERRGDGAPGRNFFACQGKGERK